MNIKQLDKLANDVEGHLNEEPIKKIILCYKCKYLGGVTHCHRYEQSCGKGHFKDDEDEPDIIECEDF